MFNKKITIELAVGIIVLIALPVGGYLLFDARKVEAPVTQVINPNNLPKGNNQNLEIPNKAYYDSFREKCNQLECCLSSVVEAEKNQSLLFKGNNFESAICPENSKPESLLCPGSFTWCVSNKIGIANPASVYCEENGGKLEIQTAADGSQTGMCVLVDGTKCEEWAFMRGECKAGDTQSQIDTSNWKTYKNEKFGFAVEYPRDWIIRENDKIIIFNSVETEKEVSNLIENKIGADAIPDISIEYFEKLKDEYNFNAGDYKALEEYLVKSGSFSSIQEIILSNEKAWFVKSDSDIILYSVYVEHNNHLYVISLGKEWLFGKTDNFSFLPEISENFLSTFRFTDTKMTEEICQ